MKGPFVIAVDGPAASGKGTIAKRLGETYELPVLDTGLLYRAVGVLAQKAGDIDDPAACKAAAATLTADQLADPALRTREAGELASRAAVHPHVREALLAFQQTFAGQEGGAVLDGRDIGTVIAPEADVKLFVTASPEVRAERRLKELEQRGMHASYEDVLGDIHARDERDSSREVAPLKPAPDAIMLDTSELDIAESIAEAVRLVEQRLAGA